MRRVGVVWSLSVGSAAVVARDAVAPLSGTTTSRRYFFFLPGLFYDIGATLMSER